MNIYDTLCCCENYLFVITITKRHATGLDNPLKPLFSGYYLMQLHVNELEDRHTVDNFARHCVQYQNHPQTISNK